MKQNPYKGKFIVFEGIDGSGKTTQFRKLTKYLKENKKNILITKEPTRGRIGKVIYNILEGREKTSHVFLQLLFSTDRAEHLERKVIPALKAGKTVLCDRYLFSTLAYGNSEIGDMDWLENLSKYFILPDITFLIKVSPSESIHRVKDIRKKDSTIFEKEKKLEKIWKNYKSLSKKYKNFQVIGGERGKKEIFEDVKKIIDKKIR